MNKQEFVAKILARKVPKFRSGKSHMQEVS